MITDLVTVKITIEFFSCFFNHWNLTFSVLFFVMHALGFHVFHTLKLNDENVSVEFTKSDTHRSSIFQAIPFRFLTGG